MSIEFCWEKVSFYLKLYSYYIVLLILETYHTYASSKLLNIHIQYFIKQTALMQQTQFCQKDKNLLFGEI